MKKKKAIILLSTYNGEKYIKEFLESVINQTYQNLELMIRDDGSKDQTVNILKRYQKKYSNITLILDNDNLGYPTCFYKLTDKAPKADYYFFADQDDVWYPEKVEKAILELEKYPSTNILAYYARYHICDDKLNIKGISPKREKEITFKDTIFEVCGLEFTMAINRKALLLLNQNKPLKAKARGTWMSMLFSAFGKIIYDNNPCALYRRHEQSVTSNKLSGIGLWIWRIKHFFKKNEFNSYQIILNDFKKITGSKLKQKDKKTLDTFIGKNRFKKVFFVGRLRSSLMDEFALRIIFLLGKL